VMRTPLFNFHTQQGGKMVEYAGWEMPIVYQAPGGTGSIHDEHTQVRTAAGLFDVSHMGRVKVTGRHARKLIERLCTRRIHDMQAGQCRYSLMCNERGGVHDDVIVYRMDEDDFLVVVNAANREKILAHMDAVRVAGDLNAKIDDQTMNTAMVALQGPRVIDFVSKISTEIPSLKRYRFTVKNLIIVKLVVSRTGYTGEDGVEVILPETGVEMALKMLLSRADGLVKPAGLGARDTLRLEAGMPLYGHELGEEMSALSAGVDFAISLEKDADEHGEKFVGMDALKKVAAAGGPPQRIVGLKIDGKRTARQGMPVRNPSGAEIGTVTSGCMSPTFGYPIAMAMVTREHTPVGTKLQVDTGKGTLEGEVVPLPFYKPKK
jgi:aminomethyltransferase